MNPSAGTFISMDTYQGNMYEPVTLHKYLYANANPVKYTDPSGNVTNLVDLSAGMSIREILGSTFSSCMCNALIGMGIGALTGAADAWLGGGSTEEIIEEALLGAAIGLVMGYLISVLTHLAVVFPIALCALQTFRYIMLGLSGWGV